MMRFRLSLSLLLLSSSIAAAACGDTQEDASSDVAPIKSVDSALGEELEPNEPALIQQISRAATEQVARSVENGNGIAKRDAHSKAHGCVTASMEVSRNIPADLAIGTFQPGKTYDAWIRFSNGSKNDDRDNDARGMAIKLLGVDGPRLLDNEEPTARTHDIVLTNHHTFFIRSIAEYVQFMSAVVDKGNPLSFFVSWNPLEWNLRAGWLARNFTTQPISSPLTSQYWSTTPYLLGDKAVKYSARPCNGADRSGVHENEPNYLAKALKQGLRNGDGACFDFMIQRRKDAKDMPIEDSTVTWSEDDSPFVPVAKIRVPAQAFDSTLQQRYCENLSFSPWHATTPHRPLGRINRTRRVVYNATSEARHQMNGVRRTEPTDLVVR
jgi:hypothetical protein